MAKITSNDQHNLLSLLTLGNSSYVGIIFTYIQERRKKPGFKNIRHPKLPIKLIFNNTKERAFIVSKR